jgi:hypothetical protein
MRVGRTPIAAAAIWVTAAIGLTVYAITFYPGHMSFDSAYAWWQARGGETSDISSPTLVLIWRALDQVLPGPGLVFLLHLSLFWCGLAWLASASSARLPMRVGLMLIIAAAPVSLVVLAHLWTDAGLIAGLTLASGALLQLARSARRIWLLPAAIGMFYALAMRYNAAPAVVPLLVYAAGLLGVPRFARRLALAILALLLLLLPVQLINRSVDRQVALLPSLQLWDLAAISIKVEKQLLPDFAVGPGMDVGDLRQAFRPWSNTPLYSGTRAGIREPLLGGWTSDELRAISRAWREAIASYPQAYLEHRWRLLGALVGTHDRDWPRELIFSDGETAYRDNPPVLANTSTAHALLMRGFEAGRDTAWLAAWPYLIAGLIALVLAWRQRHRLNADAALAFSGSAWFYALPLIVMAPAAELRYLGWTCVSCVLSLLLALNAQRRQDATYARADPWPDGKRDG